jgi:hypothetical protein
MKLFSPIPSARMACVVLCAGAAAGQAQDFSRPVRSMGLARHIEIGGIAAESEESGNYRAGISELEEIARESRDSGDRAAWVEAELALVRLSDLAGDTGLNDALQELTVRAREWDLAAQEADVYFYWAARLEREGRWRSALRALEAAAQASLGGNLPSRAVRAFLEMSRLCRTNEHPWRLQQVWLRLQQVEDELRDSLDAAALLALEDERALSFPALEGTVPQKPATPRVDLQPPRSSVKVSRSHGEIGRTKLMLTNETLQTVKGSLSVQPGSAGLKSWSRGLSGQWLTLGDGAAAAPEKRDLTLRPGEQLNLYVEREPAAAADAVSLLWESGGQKIPADISFLFEGETKSAVPASGFVNAGSFTVRPGWPVPLYQELNYRGPGTSVEDFQFISSVPCRLEIFDADSVLHPSVDAGELLAIDAEGDGCFTGTGDRVFSDSSRDGMPDLIIGNRSRSLELYAWPLSPLPEGEEIIISASLRRPRRPAEWRTDAENTIREEQE